MLWCTQVHHKVKYLDGDWKSSTWTRPPCAVAPCCMLLNPYCGYWHEGHARWVYRYDVGYNHSLCYAISDSSDPQMHLEGVTPSAKPLAPPTVIPTIETHIPNNSLVVTGTVEEHSTMSQHVLLNDLPGPMTPISALTRIQNAQGMNRSFRSAAATSRVAGGPISHWHPSTMRGPLSTMSSRTMP